MKQVVQDFQSFTKMNEENVSEGYNRDPEILSGTIRTTLRIIDNVDKIPAYEKVVIGNQDLPKGTYDIILYRRGEYLLKPHFSNKEEEEVKYIVDENDLLNAVRPGF